MGIPCTLFPNNFNPRPREGSDRIFLTAVCLQSHFNPRPREGSDTVDNLTPIGLFAISIHAPARGATHDFKLCQRVLCDFNPRPREGSDAIFVPTSKIIKNFNPRPREGSDIPAFPPHPCMYVISIHAPARGATINKGIECVNTAISIPAPARGATHMIFNRFKSSIHFNPRPREGSDDTACNDVKRPLMISIHAPARGATFIFLIRLI